MKIPSWAKRQLKVFVCKAVRLLPRSNIIFFESHRGLSISCSPKAIFKELSKLHPEATYVWSYSNICRLARDKDTLAVKFVRRRTFSYFYYLFRASVLIQNGEFPVRIPYSKKVLYINTQHGTPLKKIGPDINYRKNQDYEPVRWDFLITDNSFATRIFRRFIHPECPILEIGYPRNDMLFSKKLDQEALKKKFGLPAEKKIVLYAPTWREYAPNLNFLNFLEKLSDNCSEKYFFLFRGHHLARMQPIEWGKSIKDVSDDTYDIQELCAVADCLITDYSSTVFDYLYLERPILFFTFDYELYKEHRGLYFDLEELRFGPVFYNTNDLSEYLNRGDLQYDSSRLRPNGLAEVFTSTHVGLSSRIIAQLVIKFLMGKDKKALSATVDELLTTHQTLRRVGQ